MFKSNCNVSFQSWFSYTNQLPKTAQYKKNSVRPFTGD